MTASPEPTGTIYDIGYRRYTGARLGRRGAIGAIVGSGLRAVFGLGRSGRSKILPWGAVVLAILPAVVAIAIRVLAGDIVEIYNYENYLWEIGLLLPIFVAAQSPELVVNDLRQQVVPLYFSRPISRLDYVAAKLAALSIGLLSITLLPVLLLFIGRVLAAEDLLGALGDEIGFLPAIIGSGVIHAVVLASIGLAVCSLSGRRAYAAAAILAIFLVGSVMSITLQELGGGLRDVSPFTYPLSILDGTREWLFGGTVSGSPVASADVAMPLYGLAAVALVGVSWAVLAVRYRSVSA
jgi:ABC-2 type transport system permease protein